MFVSFFKMTTYTRYISSSVNQQYKHFIEINIIYKNAIKVWLRQNIILLVRHKYMNNINE